jgi:hypothetical protein
LPPFALAFAILGAVFAFPAVNDVEPVLTAADGASSALPVGGGALPGADIFLTGGKGFSLALPSLPTDTTLDLSLAAALAGAFSTFAPRTGDNVFFLRDPLFPAGLSPAPSLAFSFIASFFHGMGELRALTINQTQ